MGSILPTWLACFDITATERLIGTMAEGRLVHGPLTAYKLERGCQWLAFGRGGRNIALFDGYLFDAAENQQLLGVADAPWWEVACVAGAYERWGADLFKRLDGSFLAAVWDAETQQFLLGHDVFARCPVYFGQCGRQLWFAPTVTALTQASPLGNTINRLMVALRVGNFIKLPDETFFEGVHRLRHAHYLRIDARGEITKTAYWTPLLDDDAPYLPDSMILEEFEDSLSQAVLRHLRLGVDGVLLSGGLDSSVIAALAQHNSKLHNLPILAAYSGVSPTGYEANYEEHALADITRALQMPIQRIRYEPSSHITNLLDHTLEEAKHGDEPNIALGWGGYLNLIRTIAGCGAKTILTGHGGDEWLDVDSTFFRDALRRLSWADLRLYFDMVGTDGKWRQQRLGKRLTRFTRQSVVAYWAQFSPKTRYRYLKYRWQTTMFAWLGGDPALREQVIEAALTYSNYPETTRKGKVPPSLFRHYRRYWWELFGELVNCEAEFTVGRGQGVRILSPFYDRKFVELIGKASPNVLIHRRRNKSLGRDIIQKYLGGIGLEAQTKDYRPNSQQLMFRDLSPTIPAAYREIGYKRLKALEIIQPKRLEAMVNSLDANNIDEMLLLYGIVSTEMWLGEQNSTAIGDL